MLLNMSLRDTEEKLYDPNSEIEKREHSKSAFDFESAGGQPGVFIESKSWWETFKMRWLTDDRRKAIYVSSIILGFIIFLILVFFFFC